MKYYVLNGPIVVDFGAYEYNQISLEEAKWLLTTNYFISAISHEGTALLLTYLFDVKIECNPIHLKMDEGDIAVVFSLLRRPKEGQVLQIDELSSMDYTIGLFKKKCKTKKEEDDDLS